jgi:hypothetical protein
VTGPSKGLIPAAKNLTRIPTHAAPHASHTYIIGCLHASHGMPTPWPNDAAIKDAPELTGRE